ncbi:MAG: ATP synthase F1 subunit delta [Oligoflexia bacterium]|nr:ATP synthase F1 subunit delta [Oligoflexia bacterium]
MKSQEAALRYARALYEIVKEKKSVESGLNQLREFTKALNKDVEIQSFFVSPSVSKELRQKVLDALFEKSNIQDELKGLLTILVEKNRMMLLEAITISFEKIVDESLGVVRGQVESATTLIPEERQNLEKTISRYTGKKVVLEYQENKELLGGLVARVGSYTFDDSLESQLRLMKEALVNRRAH